MSLLDDCLAGVYLSTTAFSRDLPLDFAVENDGWVVLALAGWWQRDWSFDGDLFLVRGKIEADPVGWKITRDDAVRSWIMRADLKEIREPVMANRASTDFDRQAYLVQLAALMNALGEEWRQAVGSWQSAIERRPERDPVVEAKARAQADRGIGIVSIRRDGRRVDALVIDDRGEAATAHGDPWLESIGSQWMALAPRPSIVEFLAWVAEQTPYGGAELEQPREGNDHGTLQAIALRSVPNSLSRS